MRSLLFCFLFVQFSTFAQCDSSDFIRLPEVNAEFPGGIIEMKKFIQENIEYPDIKGNACHQFTGRIYLRFTVCESGEIHNITCLRCSDTEYDQIAIDLIEKMPNWIPAKVDGERISSLVCLPITICLE